MNRPLLLDLYCCEGGASLGYHRAGFDVVGVDVDGARLGRYPFAHHHGDALQVLQALVFGEPVSFVGAGGQTSMFFLQDFAAIAASPPCQRFTHGNAGSGAASKWPDLIGPTRDLMVLSGLPYVIENVPRAPLVDPVVLCGTHFGLTATDTDGTLLHLKRHRLFESNVALTAPGPCSHPRGVQWAGVYGGARRDKVEARTVRKGGYVPPDVDVLRALIGGPDRLDVAAMSERGLFESIPPAYTRHLGSQLLRSVRRR